MGAVALAKHGEMRRPSTDGGVEGVNDRAAPRGTRSKVVALGARRARGQSLPGADLELATFLHRLLGDVTAGAELDRVLAAIVQGAAHLCGVQMAAVSLLREDRQQIEVVSVYGTPGGTHGTRLPVAASLSGSVIRSGRTLRCGDARRLRDSTRAAFAHRNEIRGLYIVPLRGPDGPIGTLAAAKKVPWQCTGEDPQADRRGDGAQLANGRPLRRAVEASLRRVHHARPRRQPPPRHAIG